MSDESFMRKDYMNFLKKINDVAKIIETKQNILNSIKINERVENKNIKKKKI